MMTTTQIYEGNRNLNTAPQLACASLEKKNPPEPRRTQNNRPLFGDRGLFFYAPVGAGGCVHENVFGDSIW